MLPANLVKNKPAFKPGEVALVGAGPGDPDLLTLQAFRFISQAEVAVYDRLVSEEIRSLLPSGCELIYVGKKQADHRVPQDRINEILVEQAQLNKKVLRLKGGDPFIFGRGGEEAIHLINHNVACHIIPGMTAASACAAYSGIPLTHRNISQSCTLVTGHMQDGDTLDLPWDNLIQGKQTLVFYMGIKQLPKICENLIKYGLPSSTAIALIRKGTTPDHTTLKGNLSNIELLVQQHNITPPTLIIVGQVVNEITLATNIINGYFPQTK